MRTYEVVTIVRNLTLTVTQTIEADNKSDAIDEAEAMVAAADFASAEIELSDGDYKSTARREDS